MISLQVVVSSVVVVPPILPPSVPSCLQVSLCAHADLCVERGVADGRVDRLEWVERGLGMLVVSVRIEWPRGEEGPLGLASSDAVSSNQDNNVPHTARRRLPHTTAYRFSPPHRRPNSP